MNGRYLELQVRTRVVGPIIAFREYIFRDVLPAFGHLQERADQVAQEYYNQIGSMPSVDDCEIDMASVAEAARDRSLSWYEMMMSLRQTMRNLVAAGCFTSSNSSWPPSAGMPASRWTRRGTRSWAP